MTLQPFTPVAELLGRTTGMEFPDARLSDVERAARLLMRERRIDTVAELVDLLARTPNLLAELVDALVVPETYFFRHPEQFDFIRDVVVPQVLRERPRDHVLKVWSAGCASGEEPYSLAMLLDGMGLLGRSRVMGTDISEPLLMRARLGIYRPWSFRQPSAERARPYVRARRDGASVAPRIRESVRFARINMVTDPLPSSTNGTEAVDVILCRNVFIYFDDATVARMARRFFDCLAPGGWLLTAAADPLLVGHAPFRAVIGAGIAYEKPPRATAVIPEAPQLVLPPPAPRRSAPRARPVITARRRPPAPTPVPHVATPLDRAQQALQDGRYEDVLLLAGKHPRDASIAALAARALANRGQLHDAESRVRLALDDAPLDVELHFLHAVLLLAEGRLQHAVDAVRKVLYLDGGLAVAHLLLGRLLLMQGDAEGARRAFRTARQRLREATPEEPVALGDGQKAGELLASAEDALAGLGA